MLTDREIKRLINSPKEIVSANPSKGMKPDAKSEVLERRSLEIRSLCMKNEFIVFLRKNTLITEQFSIGLIYKTRQKNPDKILFLRYNGSHGTKNFSKDGHYGDFHIHSIDSHLIESGIYEPKNIELTDAYNSFDSAVVAFLRRINIQNINNFFPENAKQIELFPDYD